MKPLLAQPASSALRQKQVYLVYKECTVRLFIKQMMSFGLKGLLLGFKVYPDVSQMWQVLLLYPGEVIAYK